MWGKQTVLKLNFKHEPLLEERLIEKLRSSMVAKISNSFKSILVKALYSAAFILMGLWKVHFGTGFSRDRPCITYDRPIRSQYILSLPPENMKKP